MTRPCFIVLDGLDGTGKTTQCRLLADWLRGQGLTVTECADPGGTPAGDVIREWLLVRRQELTLACEAFLFMASRAQLTSEIIRPALGRGEIVISDRYLLANVVYQGHAGGLDVNLLWSMGELATGGLEPDLTLVLDMPTEKAQERRNRPADRMESRAYAFHERVRRGFIAEAGKCPDRIQLVDASRSINEIQADLRSATMALVIENS